MGTRLTRRPRRGHARHALQSSRIAARPPATTPGPRAGRRGVGVANSPSGLQQESLPQTARPLAARATGLYCAPSLRNFRSSADNKRPASNSLFVYSPIISLAVTRRINETTRCNQLGTQQSAYAYGLRHVITVPVHQDARIIEPREGTLPSLSFAPLRCGVSGDRWLSASRHSPTGAKRTGSLESEETASVNTPAASPGFIDSLPLCRRLCTIGAGA